MRNRWQHQRQEAEQKDGSVVTMATDNRYDNGTKHTFFHVTVQEYNERNHHFLVPRLSEQALNDPVQVSAEGLSRGNPRTGPTESQAGGQQRMTNVFYLSDKSKSASKQRHKENQNRKQPHQPSISVGFSAAMKPAGYAECVSVTDAPPIHEQSVVTFCDFVVDARFKSAVNIGPGLSPAWFRSSVVCHNTTTKKNFRNSVDYVPKMKPLKFGETQYVRPKHLVMTYVSYCDYNADGSQKWYTTSIQLVPTTNSSNTVHNFQMRQRTVTDDSSSSESSSDGESDVEKRDLHNDVIGDINMNLIKDDGAYQPPMLMSSGPEGDNEQRFGTTHLSHRTKMVVGEAPAQRMNQEDYVVYLQGYASTSEVIKHGYVQNGDLTNGFLLDHSNDSISEA